MGKFLDIVIGGPDHSGTTTQINDAINLFKSKDLVVKDLRGDEFNALFHSEKIQFEIQNNYTNLKEFDVHNILFHEHYKTINQDINLLLKEKKYASMVKNDIYSYINPDSADVWILEEPSTRKIGAAIRSNILYASKFGIEYDKLEEANAYALDRKIEYNLFRKPLRDSGKIIIRSRSEESAAYQVFHNEFNPLGPTIGEFADLPGNKNALINYPSHIFIVSGDSNWTYEDSKRLQEERGSNKNADDKELNIGYQKMVAKRYGSGWVENLYKLHNDLEHEQPKFFYTSILDSIEKTKQFFDKNLTNIYNKWLEENKL